MPIRSVPDDFERVMVPFVGINKKLELDKPVMFWRPGWDEPKRLILLNTDPAFNVSGLFFKPES